MLDQSTRHESVSSSRDYVVISAALDHTTRYKMNPSKSTQVCILAKVKPKVPVVLSVLTSNQPGGGFRWDSPDVTAFSWHGCGSILATGTTLPSGSYILQLALDPNKTNVNISDLHWALDLAPTNDEKDCPITEDDTKKNFLQVQPKVW